MDFGVSYSPTSPYMQSPGQLPRQDIAMNMKYMYVYIYMTIYVDIRIQCVYMYIYIYLTLQSIAELNS